MEYNAKEVIEDLNRYRGLAVRALLELEEEEIVIEPHTQTFISMRDFVIAFQALFERVEALEKRLSERGDGRIFETERAHL